MRRSFIALCCLVLVVGACGSDEADGSGAATEASAREPVTDQTTTTPAPSVTAVVSSEDEPAEDEAAIDAALVQLDGCGVSTTLERGVATDEVLCLEAQLVARGFLPAAVPGGDFDPDVEAAVRAFQTEEGLAPDGVVGPLTATALGVWVEPPTPTPNPATCEESGRSAVVDRDYQRAWLCEDGAITYEMVMTSALTQPDPGSYSVYAKDLDAWSDLSGKPSTMTHFVAFTRGKYQGARIAFHSMPKYEDGSFIQPLDTLGSAAWHGDSAGCIRVLPDAAVLIWDWLAIGDTVNVVS